MERETRRDVERPVRKANGTTIALIGGLVLLLIVIAYLTTRGNADQDKLKDGQVMTAADQPASDEKLCASNATYDLIKRDLFRRAAQVRGSDQAAYDRIAAAAALRMENPVMESENSDTHAISCSGSLSLDLPPGVAVVGGRTSLTSDVDYTVQPAADGSGNVVLLRNADAIVTPLATLARVSQPAATPSEPVTNEVEAGTAAQPEPPAMPAPPVAPQAPRPVGARPSFDCGNARTKGEVAVCSDAGLASLDRNMSAQYVRSLDAATPDQRRLLQQTRDRFLAYRDRCPNRACIGDAYTGRMREIRDIMEGNWRPR